MALAVNFVFFGLESKGSWERGFRPLWRMFLSHYLEISGDREVMELAPPYLAWRALVIANPVFYPDLAPTSRDGLLRLAEVALERGAVRMDDPEMLFR
jgi:hypothetical protein